MNDERLIREYVTQGSEQAFEELVRRYAGLVHGTACRQVGDVFVAEEVTQKVFCALAAQIKGIRKPSHLPAWLYQTTRRLAAMHVRTEQRRATRERMAMELPDSHTNESWEGIEPLLNEGLDNLGDADRTAILLRFFREMSMAEVAEGLGVSEAAAKMRIVRAVDKLRTFFVRHGVTCSVAALALLLEKNASAQPPASLIGSVISQLGHPVKGPHAARMLSKASAGKRLGLPIGLGVLTVGLLLWYVGPFSANKQSGPPAAIQADQAIERPIPSPPATKQNQALVPKGYIRLTVLDENTATPLVGVRATASNLGKVLGEANTDWDGHCDLPRPPDLEGDFYYKLRAEYAGYATMDASWSRFQRDELSDIPESLELKLPRGIRIGGLVTDEEGQLLAGVQIRLQSIWTQPGAPPRTRAILNDGSGETISTDKDGRWFFDRLPPDWEDIRFRVKAKEFVPAEYACDANRHPGIGDVTIPKEALLAMKAQFVLRRGPLVNGQVLDENNNPIAGVRLVQNFNWNDEFAASVTAADGTYRILNAPTGTLSLCLQADHFSPQTVTFQIEGPTTNPPIVLTRGHLIRGRVVDGNGNPLEGVWVAVNPNGRQPQEFQWRINTDATGTFAWDGAPANPISLRLIKSGFQMVQVSSSPDAVEQTIVLQRSEKSGIRIEGQVSDEATGEPIPAFKYLLREEDVGLVVPKEGADGRFTVRLDDNNSVVKIEIQAVGYESTNSEAVSTTNGDQTVAFKLRRCQGWFGEVLLPDGKPAAGAEVTLSGDRKNPILGSRRLLFREQYTWKLTDSEGRFNFDTVKNAKLVIALNQQGYAESDLEHLTADPVLRLQPWGRVEGVLRSSGSPVANERVAITKRNWNPWILSIILHADPFIVRTDAEGNFAFDYVPPGDLALSRLFPGGLLETRATVQVVPGTTASVRLGGDGRPVTAKILAPRIPPDFDFSQSHGELKLVLPKPADLPNTARRRDFASEEAYREASKAEGARRIAWWQSDEGLATWRRARSYAVWFETDGTMHADDIPQGEYDLHVMLGAPSGGEIPGVPNIPKYLGDFTARVVISDANASNSAEAVNLGTVELKER